MSERRRFYVVDAVCMWTSMESEIMGVKAPFKRPASGSFGFLEVFESLEDLQREWPGKSFTVIEEVASVETV